MKREGTLCILAGHGVYDPATDCFYGEHPEDRPIYQAQLFYALQHLTWRASANILLVISGGLTKIERRCSESRSYVEWVQALGWRLPGNVALEEHALTTVENVLLSIYTYHRIRRVYPERLEIVSWRFKEARMAATLKALNNWELLGERWPSLDLFPVGDLTGTDKRRAEQIEAEYCAALDHGLSAYYENPAVRELIRKRDVFGCRDMAREAYAGYPLPF